VTETTAATTVNDEPQDREVETVAASVERIGDEIERGAVGWVPARVVAVDANALIPNVADAVGTVTLELVSDTTQTVTLPAMLGVLPPIGSFQMLAMNGKDPMLLGGPGQLVGDALIESANYAKGVQGWHVDAGGRVEIVRVDGEIGPFLTGADPLGNCNPILLNSYRASGSFTLPASIGTDLWVSLSCIVTGQLHLTPPNWSRVESRMAISDGASTTYGTPVMSHVLGDAVINDTGIAVIHSRWLKPAGNLSVWFECRFLDNLSGALATNLSAMWTVIPRNSP
jgi:hypothetical protein